MNISALLSAGMQQLASIGVENADLEARLLLQHLTGFSHTQLIIRGQESVHPSVAAAYENLLQQRGQRIPLHYLIGSKEFWSLDFLVTPAVLIPRPETEFLLEQVLAHPRIDRRNHPLTMLDMCTGSGVIAVVLAKELDCQVTAVDLSPAALAIAQQNIQQHAVTAQISLLCGDLFSPLREGRIFDCLVSNPPYVAELDKHRLEPEVVDAEPHLALFGGLNGLDIIWRIAEHAPKYICSGGMLFLEIGAEQKDQVLQIFMHEFSQYTDAQVAVDWAGRPRVFQAQVL